MKETSVHQNPFKDGEVAFQPRVEGGASDVMRRLSPQLQRIDDQYNQVVESRKSTGGTVDAARYAAAIAALVGAGIVFLRHLRI
jgi:hypothetical protein